MTATIERHRVQVTMVVGVVVVYSVAAAVGAGNVQISQINPLKGGDALGGVIGRDQVNQDPILVPPPRNPFTPIVGGDQIQELGIIADKSFQPISAVVGQPESARPRAPRFEFETGVVVARGDHLG